MKQAHLYRLKSNRSTRTLFVTVAASCCLLAAFLVALHTTRRRSETAETAQLATALRRACVTCYAVEGRYPANLDYIVDNYGVLVDTDRYRVRYDAFAENVMPDITVVLREEVDE